MELLVPAVFSTQFIEALRPRPVRYVYGSLPNEPSARASRSLPQATLAELGDYIAAAHSVGIGFLYTLNAGCGGNAEFTAEGQRWLADRLGWLVEAGAAGVVSANPYVMEMVKRRYPELRVHVSTLVNVDTVEKAVFYRNLGADTIYLPEYVNRDFKLLEALSGQVDRELAVVVNLGCLLHCPIRTYHANYVSHASRNLERAAYLDYSLTTCTLMKAGNPAELLKSPWIRPEDLERYEKIGIRQFKIAGREQEPAWTLRAVSAYASRGYRGNLNDLVPAFNQVDPFGRFPLVVDNTRLDGFLDFFERTECRAGCGACAYCDEWAVKAVSAVGDAERYAASLRRFIRRFTCGAFRPALSHGDTGTEETGVAAGSTTSGGHDGDRR